MSNGTILTTADDTKSLTAHEAMALERYEATIEAGIKTFLEVGEALMAIQRSRLYRARFDTFEKYVSERWGWTRQRAYQLISSSMLAKETGLPVDVLNERMTRALMPIKDNPDLVRLVMLTATTSAAVAGVRLTSNWIESTVEKAQETFATGGFVSDGNGNMNAFYAALTEDVLERTRRNQQQLQAGKQKPLLNETMEVRDLRSGLDLDGLDPNMKVRVVIYEDVSK